MTNPTISTDGVSPPGRDRQKRLLAGLLTALCLAAIAACGGTPGGNDSNPPSSPTPSQTVGAGDEGEDAPTTRASSRSTGSTGSTGATASSVPRTSTTAGDASTTSSSSVQSTTSSTPVSLNPTPGNEAFCSEFLAVGQKFNGMDELESEQQFVEYIAQLKADFDRLASTAPDAIKADWDSITTALSSVSNAQDLTKLDSDQLDAAFERIGAWTVTNCGFDPDAF
jgi:hypothetical protein